MALWGACAGQQAPPAHPKIKAQVYLSPDLKITSTHTVEEALRDPFPSPFQITVGEGRGAPRTLNHCADYLAIRDTRYSASGSLEDKRLRYLGATCDALSWIKGARPAAHPAFGNFSWRQITLRQLPPELALNLSPDAEEQARKVSARGGSILELEPDLRLRVKNANEAQLVSEDEKITLTVDAHGDFLGDGNEQLLVRWQSSVTGGSYTSVYVFLLARRNNRLVVVGQRPLE